MSSIEDDRGNEMEEFESRLTTVMKKLIEKNGIDVMNQALESLKSVQIGATGTEDEQASSCRKVQEKPSCPYPIRVTFSSKQAEFEIPPKAVFEAMHEILDCVAHAVKYVWKKMQDFFSWVWHKLSNLLNANPQQAPPTAFAR